MSAQGKHLYDFGPFRLDLGERTLCRQGVYIPLAPKSLETLIVLIERSGRIVDKDELLQLVWPGTFVEEATLAKNISILRKALAETDEHRYIETIPKRGYRFMAEVTVAEVTESLVDSVPIVQNVVQTANTPRPWYRSRNAAIVACIAVIAAAGLLLSRTWRQPLSSGAGMKAVPLTSFPGRQDQVAFSPDGTHVAFVWNGDQSEISHIYVKLLGSEALLQLTHGPASDSHPAWAPDGQTVTFLRSSAQDRAWYVTSALGGAERKIAEVEPYFDLGVGNTTYYSPDGSTLAIVDKTTPAGPSAIFILTIADGTRRQLTTPPAGTTGDYYPAFSPDGKRLAFARAISFSATDLYVVDTAGGQPRRLTFDGITIEGLAWTNDSRDVVFSSRRGGSTNSLWRIVVRGGTPERIGTFGEDVISPAISRAGSHLAYTRRLDDMNIWTYTLDGPTRLKTKTPLIASTFRDSDPDYSPDGRHVAFTSGRNGGFGIWVSDSDGSNPRLLFDGGAYVTGSPRWSPDGKHVVFDTRANDPAKGGNPSVWIVDAERGDARCLVPAPTGGVAPNWSRDGNSIYYASTQGGALQIWKMPAQGGPAVQITRHGGFEGFETEDGKYIYYLRGRGIPGIWRVPAGGGEEVQVTAVDQVGFWRCWRPAPGGIYFATATHPAGPRLQFWEMATGKVYLIDKLAHNPDLTIPGIAVAPGGRSLLVAQYDQSGSNIILADGFR